MKLNIIAALLLCASVATATETTATASAAATTTEAHGKSADAPAHGKKKAKKKAKKEEKKDGAQTAPATNNSSAQTQVAPAAATSTAAAPAVQAPAKKWGVTLLNEIDADYNAGKDIGNSTLTTINYIAGSYKITATEKVGLRQYYTYDYNPNSEKSFESSDIKQSFTVATISTKVKGILGSDDISPMFWYYMPGHTAEETNFGKDMDNFAGILRMDAEINYTLNPKWSASYYLNPRQTLGAKDEEIGFEATSRLIHYANLYYNVSDETQVYANAGFDHKMATANMTSTSDYYLSAVGLSTSFFGGKLSLNPEVNVTTPLKTKGAAAKSQNLYNKENIAYAFVTVIAL